jgi:hypothetical protein
VSGSRVRLVLDADAAGGAGVPDGTDATGTGGTDGLRE